MFSRGFKDIKTKTAIFEEFPGLENKFQNSRGFKEIKDSWESCKNDIGTKKRHHKMTKEHHGPEKMLSILAQLPVKPTEGNIK